MKNVNNEVVEFYKKLGYTLIEIKSSVFREEESTLVFQTDNKNHTVDGSTILYDHAIAIHHQLQKAREEERERISRSVNDKERQEQILANLLLRIAGVGIDFEIADSDLLTDYVVFETRPVDRYSTIYRVERNCMLDHSELDQDPVHDFFTAPEEVKRPVYERALAKTQEEQEKKLDQNKV